MEKKNRNPGIYTLCNVNILDSNIFKLGVRINIHLHANLGPNYNIMLIVHYNNAKPNRNIDLLDK